jgi:hypothetical protein
MRVIVTVRFRFRVRVRVRFRVRVRVRVKVRDRIRFIHSPQDYVVIRLLVGRRSLCMTSSNSHWTAP